MNDRLEQVVREVFAASNRRAGLGATTPESWIRATAEQLRSDEAASKRLLEALLIHEQGRPQ